ncbi:Hypothetical protein NTJ_02467 [Nesidiocoris tenuis]|uniref:Gustatory receptor n=1 Tax=Nesidiocoris tenuis TaxID=355587 RepID=A0ABN7ABM7_9HEMI|nr:Hypothetical protein NTJ_02467 [Nesidiocoris tenuis]
MRLLGLHFYDENGRTNKWYFVCLLYLSILIISTAFYFPCVLFSKLRHNYFTFRPFHTMMAVMTSLVGIASRVCWAAHLRYPITNDDITSVETFFSDDINYPVSCFDLFLIYAPFLSVILDGSVVITLFVKELISGVEALVLFAAIYLPRTLASANLAYCWCNIEMFRIQAQALRRSKADRHILAALHSHLHRYCTDLHDFYRYQVPLEFLKSIMALLLDAMYLHERVLEISEGNNSISTIIHPILKMTILTSEIWYFSSSYDGLKNEVDGFVLDTCVILLKQRKRFPDRVLSTYVSLHSEMNLSMSEFFVPTRALTISILSSTCLYYMLMVQMGILKSSFI